MVDRVLIAQRNPERTLTHKHPNRMLHETRIAMILEASRKPVHRPDNRVRLPQQQNAGVRTHRTAVEIRRNRALDIRSGENLLAAKRPVSIGQEAPA